MDCPLSKEVFDLSVLDDDKRKLREEMTQSFYLLLGGNSDIKPTWFKNEALGDAVVDCLATHWDKQNLAIKGLDVLLAFSAHSQVTSLQQTSVLPQSSDTGNIPKTKSSFWMLCG